MRALLPALPVLSSWRRSRRERSSWTAGRTR
ncbi:hypothetical protein V2I01_31045 [Micromonospora sp. BRA006-A]|nr:hypothetical protein [Micromonospora sp. BRA006-A]